MISAAIDHAARFADGRVVLSGWARYVKAELARPVDGFTLAGGVEVDICKTNRLISETPGCGFEFLLPSVDDLAAMRWGRLSLYAYVADETQVVGFWEYTNATVLEIIMIYLAELLGNNADTGALLKEAQQVKRHRDEIGWFLEATALSRKRERVTVERGSVSQDSEATIGRDGFLFLLGGSNAVLQQYAKPEDALAVSRWASVVQKRQDYCKGREITFRQMIVPEKQSVIPEFFPTLLQVPTKLFAALSAELSIEPFFLDCAGTLRNLFVQGGLHPFRKVDSHLSYFGVEALVQDFMRSIGILADVFPRTVREEQHVGDLGRKFFQGNMLESLLVPTGDWEFSREAPQLIRSQLPNEGHMGMVLDWHAHRPISNQTALIFGNSMFERGGSPLTLSWWFSRLFARTRFVWSANLEERYVVDLQPDLIVCQTVERFLPTLPER